MGEGRHASFGIITGATAYLYVKEVVPDASILKLACAHPLPEATIRAFAASVDRVLVVEELEPVLEKSVRALGIAAEGKAFFPRVGELSPELVRAGLAKAGLMEPAPASPVLRHRADGPSAGAVRGLPAHGELSCPARA